MKCGHTTIPACMGARTVEIPHIKLERAVLLIVGQHCRRVVGETSAIHGSSPINEERGTLVSKVVGGECDVLCYYKIISTEIRCGVPVVN